MKLKSLTAALAAGVLLVLGTGARAEGYLREGIDAPPVPAPFEVCHGFTCTYRTEVALRDWEWNALRRVIEPIAADAEGERQRIALAIGLFETIVGRHAGTSNDLPENDLRGVHREGQMDCVDESTNTTTYLRVLARAGLLRWHQVEEPTMRGSVMLVFGWPHWTAVIGERTAVLVERENGRPEAARRWAVDSWFYANGVPPPIVRLDVWSAGWRPEAPVHAADNY